VPVSPPIFPVGTPANDLSNSKRLHDVPLISCKVFEGWPHTAKGPGETQCMLAEQLQRFTGSCDLTVAASTASKVAAIVVASIELLEHRLTESVVSGNPGQADQ